MTLPGQSGPFYTVTSCLNCLSMASMLTAEHKAALYHRPHHCFRCMGHATQAHDLFISACFLLLFALYLSLKVVVRIKFPDRLVLQAFFRPMEKGTLCVITSWR